MNIFIKQHITEVVKILQTNTWLIDYKFREDDPEYANAYIVEPNNPNKILAIISSVIRWRQARPDWILPKKAKSCIQISSKNKDLISNIKRVAKNNLTIIMEEENDN